MASDLLPKLCGRVFEKLTHLASSRQSGLEVNARVIVFDFACSTWAAISISVPWGSSHAEPFPLRAFAVGLCAATCLQQFNKPLDYDHERCTHDSEHWRHSAQRRGRALL